MNTEPTNPAPKVGSSDLFSAAKELYKSSTLLRLRMMQVKAVVREFSEWGRHTEAMRKMERALREAENDLSSATIRAQGGEDV